jgi:hypothetical protein
MGNIAFITTKKHIRSYNMFSLLQKINESKFDGKLNIVDDISAWSINYQNNWDSINYYIRSPRKIGAKHPHNNWMPYVFSVFQNELGYMTDGKLSDECCNEFWLPEKDKWESYKEYRYEMNSWMEDENSRTLRTIEDLRDVPPDMAGY